MFKQVKVDIIGMVENMSYFVCPHCNHEVDPFGKGGGERTAKDFGIEFLGGIELDPNIREGGDSGHPVVLAGENSRHAQSLFKFTRKVVERVDQLNAADTGSVLSVD